MRVLPWPRDRQGVALLAKAAGAKVLPFGLAGTDQMMPPFLEDFHGKVIAGIPVSIQRGPLAVAFGKPVALEPGESFERFAERLQTECYSLTRLAEQAVAAAKQGAVRTGSRR